MNLSAENLKALESLSLADLIALASICRLDPEKYSEHFKVVHGEINKRLKLIFPE